MRLLPPSLTSALAAVCLVGASLSSAPPAHAEEVVEGAPLWSLAQTLIANERTAWDVYFRRDVAAPNLLSDDYIDLIVGNEVADRDTHLAAIAEADLSAYELEGFRVIRLSDDAMLVTYQATWTDNDGVSGQVAVTSGWAPRDGVWKNVFYRESPLN